MRLKLQRLIFASLLLCIATLFFLYRPTQLSHNNGFLSPLFHSRESRLPLSASTVIVYHNSTASQPVQRFWATWARYIADARPSMKRVTVDYAANNVAALDVAGAYRVRPISHVALTESEMQSMKNSHSAFQSHLDNLDIQDDAITSLFTGAGIVTVVGGEYFGPAIVGIKMLRKTGSTLPVEAFLPDWDEYEEELCEQILPNLNARCMVLSDFLAPAEGETEKGSDAGFKITHYQLKGLAILFSTFENVLYLDSDSIPLVDPNKELFTTEPYTATGFVGWPDFWVGTESPLFYEITGMEKFPNDTLPPASSEAGQLLVDKSKHLKTLLLAAYYNVWGGVYYPLLSQGAMGEGDKNTFETAALVLGLPFYRVKSPVMAIGRWTSGQFKGSGMVQFHPTDDMAKFGNGLVKSELTKRQVDRPLGAVVENVRPAFMHSNTPKMNAGHLVDEGDLVDSDKGEGLRLWGDVEQQNRVFGEDLESKVWEVLVEVGCTFAGVIKEWKARKDLCLRLKSHKHAVFATN
ncbi:nucleotide-diphospho-sugar transferase [Tothia fuscella]|uniref:Nucleotide-diphospho-sugar transferase n=1 Tax=Tothia fuscella TaxID=1048955 RepID=A0A9P4TSY7_9PEZI|nr:nucleotide-diphospho-sugar transferase [Tothia fuscella]